MKRGDIVAVVPMKPLHLSKSRLARRLTPAQRATLSLNMLIGVIRAAVASPAREVWVVGGGDAVMQASLSIGAEWSHDEGKDLNDTLWRAFDKAFASGMAAMYLPADLPFVTSDDIAAMIEASDNGKWLTLSPAQRDGGTNAIIVPRSSPFRPALGLDSFSRHMAQADALRLDVAVCESPGLALDLDTPDDLAVCEKLEPGLMARLVGETGTISFR